MTSSASDHITTSGKSPAFQFYANDFTGGTVDLSAEEVGVYIRLLCYQWEKGSIPADTTAQARIGGVLVARMRKIWDRISRHFIQVDDTFHNRRLERVRQDMLAFRRRQSDAGKASAAHRKATGHQPESNRGSTTVAVRLQPEANSSSSVFGLQSSHKRSSGASDGMGEDENLRAIAYELREIYPEVFAACRSGATYRTTRATEARDNPNYYGCAELHPNIKKLRALLEIFLTRPQFADKSSPGTPGQFLHMLPECDEILRRSGWKATA